MKPFLFWVDPTTRVEGLRHTPLLFPFWGNALTEQTPYQKQVFDSYSFDTSRYGLADRIEDADMILVPHTHTMLRSRLDILDRASRIAHTVGKKFLVDGTGDIERPISHTNAVVLRYGGYRFRNAPNEIHIPLYTDDLLERIGVPLAVRTYSDVPAIGFSGWAGMSRAQVIKTMLKEFPTRVLSLIDDRYAACRKGVFFRQDAIHALEGATGLRTNFLIRDSYSGHRSTASADPAALRREFIENLLSSDYALDVRGDANASQRLFEILSLGRIPVILDTERNFPFSDEIDYQSFALVVDFRERHRLASLICQFHASLSPEKFETMQRAAREVYVRYFRLDSMTAPLIDRLRAAQ